MDSLSDGIRAAKRLSVPPSATGVPIAKDVMATDVVHFRPEQTVKDAIATLLKYRISGGPVVDARLQLLGVISELDCLRVLASSSYDGEPPNGQRTVGELMSTKTTTVEPTTDLYAIAHLFLDQRVRRLPVLQNGRVVGQVSRRDVLRAMVPML